MTSYRSLQSLGDLHPGPSSPGNTLPCLPPGDLETLTEWGGGSQSPQAMTQIQALGQAGSYPLRSLRLRSCLGHSRPRGEQGLRVETVCLPRACAHMAHISLLHNTL